MGGQLALFLGSLAAILALVALTYLLGFDGTARLHSEQEARALLQLAPGGFEPSEIGLDADGASAIARDRQGRLAVLVPHGNRFVVRLLAPQTKVAAHDGKLIIDGLPKVKIALGDCAKDWATTDIDANNS